MMTIVSLKVLRFFVVQMNAPLQMSTPAPAAFQP